MNKELELPKWICRRCGHIWVPRIPNKPVQCPACHSPYWDEPMSKGMILVLKKKGVGKMDFLDKLGKLLIYMCDKYEEDDTFRQYGDYPWPIIDESGIDFGDGGAQLEAMEVLRKQGLIEVVRQRRNAKIQSSTAVRPSVKGLELVKEKRKSRSRVLKQWPTLVSAVTAGIVKGLKG